MICLGIENTRRCNINCLHCGRGEPQNIDMDEKIINKTFQEVSGIYIRTMRITGGEPFLNPAGIEYIVDSMIKHNVKVHNIEIFTNGSIQNEKIAMALKRLCAYLNEIKVETQKYQDECFKGYTFRLNENNAIQEIKSGNVYCCVSQQYHLDCHSESTVSYYQKKVGMNNFFITSQNPAVFETAWKNLEGNLLKNYQMFPKEELQNVLIKSNRYCIINDDNGRRITEKILTVSANGNVFVGNLIAYKKVDSESTLFNILDCQNNFMDLVDSWCWKNPINSITNRKYEEFMAYEWLKEKGLLCPESPLNKYESYPVSVIDYVRAAEKDLTKIHNMFPYLTHNEVEDYYTVDVCSGMGTENDMCKFFLQTFTKCGDSMIWTILNIPQYCAGRKTELALENALRKIDKDKMKAQN